MSATLDNDMQAITGLSRTNPRITFRKTAVMQSCAKSYKDTVGKRSILCGLLRNSAISANDMRKQNEFLKHLIALSTILHILLGNRNPRRLLSTPSQMGMTEGSRDLKLPSRRAFYAILSRIQRQAYSFVVI
jgi:hypothetical protein